MSAYDLPTSLTIGGVGFPIRSGWRAIVDILVACGDSELDDETKALVLLQIMFPEWEKIPESCIPEALEKACAFIDCGQKDDGKPRPKMIDWEQDAPIIIPEVNKVAGREVRIDPNIHWWTFFGFFMEILNIYSIVLCLLRVMSSECTLPVLKFQGKYHVSNQKNYIYSLTETHYIIFKYNIALYSVLF